MRVPKPTMSDFPKAYPKPDWLPNWRDESAYEDHGDDLEAWAWECLRRDPEYQADYARWAALPDTMICEDGQSCLSPKFDLAVGDWTPMKFCHSDSAAITGDETAGQYETRTGIWPCETLYVYLSRKWGMVQPCDPASSNPPDWDCAGDATREMPPYSIPEFDDSFSISGFNVGYEDRKGRLLYAWWPSDHDAYLSCWAFDLRFNIDDQIDLVREILKERQNEEKLGDETFGKEPLTVIGRPSRKGRSTLQTDIRILDAKWSAASDGEVIAALWGEPRKPPRPDGGAYEDLQRKAMEQKIKDAMARITWRVTERGWGDLVRWSLLPQSKKNQKRSPGITE